MATVVTIKLRNIKKALSPTPFQKKLLDAPIVSKKQIKLIEDAGKLIGKWKI